MDSFFGAERERHLYAGRRKKPSRCSLPPRAQTIGLLTERAVPSAEPWSTAAEAVGAALAPPHAAAVVWAAGGGGRWPTGGQGGRGGGTASTSSLVHNGTHSPEAMKFNDEIRLEKAHEKR